MDLTRLRVAQGVDATSIVEFADRWSLVAEAVVYVGRRKAIHVEGIGWSVSRTTAADLTITIQDVDLPAGGS